MKALTAAEQNRLIMDHMDLVPPIAAEYRTGEVDFEDICAAGTEGLVRAARSYQDQGHKFSTYAVNGIRLSIFNFINSSAAKERINRENLYFGGRVEKIFEWKFWGERGNAEAICERWSKLDATPDELSERYNDIKTARHRFEDAFKSLTPLERNVFKRVYLRKEPTTLHQAARDLDISYKAATTALKRALITIRKAILRMEFNEQQGPAGALSVSG